jgi:NAD(P)-dependent dehydrogenase (short-subunit alcohol dehydrogenase family)
MTIKDKTILVTGANRGIGQALAAEALARGAARVYAGTRQPLPFTDSRVTALRLDVTSTAQVQAAAGQVGSLDMLINNAGVAVPDDRSRPAAVRHPGLLGLEGGRPGPARGSRLGAWLAAGRVARGWARGPAVITWIYPLQYGK